jgi:hypothetical protein
MSSVLLGNGVAFKMFSHFLSESYIPRLTMEGMARFRSHNLCLFVALFYFLHNLFNQLSPWDSDRVEALAASGLCARFSASLWQTDEGVAGCYGRRHRLDRPARKAAESVGLAAREDPKRCPGFVSANVNRVDVQHIGRNLQ